MSNVMIIRLAVVLIKKISLCKKSYFPEPYTNSKSKRKAELDLSSYIIKSDLINTIGWYIKIWIK